MKRAKRQGNLADYFEIEPNYGVGYSITVNGTLHLFAFTARGAQRKGEKWMERLARKRDRVA